MQDVGKASDPALQERIVQHGLDPYIGKALESAGIMSDAQLKHMWSLLMPQFGIVPSINFIQTLDAKRQCSAPALEALYHKLLPHVHFKKGDVMAALLRTGLINQPEKLAQFETSLTDIGRDFYQKGINPVTLFEPQVIAALVDANLTEDAQLKAMAPQLGSGIVPSLAFIDAVRGARLSGSH